MHVQCSYLKKKNLSLAVESVSCSATHFLFLNVYAVLPRCWLNSFFHEVRN